MYKEFLEIVGNGSPTDSVLKETMCSFRHDINKSGKMTQSNTSPNSFVQQKERESIENPKSQRKNVSVALQGLPQRNLQQLIL